MALLFPESHGHHRAHWTDSPDSRNSVPGYLQAIFITVVGFGSVSLKERRFPHLSFEDNNNPCLQGLF